MAQRRLACGAECASRSRADAAQLNTEFVCKRNPERFGATAQFN
jgi:hypothetical protein